MSDAQHHTDTHHAEWMVGGTASYEYCKPVRNTVATPPVATGPVDVVAARASPRSYPFHKYLHEREQEEINKEIQP